MFPPGDIILHSSWVMRTNWHAPHAFHWFTEVLGRFHKAPLTNLTEKWLCALTAVQGPFIPTSLPQFRHNPRLHRTWPAGMCCDPDLPWPTISNLGPLDHWEDMFEVKVTPWHQYMTSGGPRRPRFLTKALLESPSCKCVYINYLRGPGITTIWPVRHTDSALQLNGGLCHIPVAPEILGYVIHCPWNAGMLHVLFLECEADTESLTQSWKVKYNWI